ncbi:hypothetical protein JOQ06_000425, partial [Pogonophryne albipinna]
ERRRESKREMEQKREIDGGELGRRSGDAEIKAGAEQVGKLGLRVEPFRYRVPPFLPLPLTKERQRHSQRAIIEILVCLGSRDTLRADGNLT